MISPPFLRLAAPLRAAAAGISRFDLAQPVAYDRRVRSGRRVGRCRRFARSCAWIVAFVAGTAAGGTARAQPETNRVRLAETQRQEGEAMLALADAAADGKSVPADFRLAWHNDFLKAQQGTFVPFTLTLEGASPPGAILLYVRATPRGASAGEGNGGRAPAVDAIVPVRTVASAPGRVRATRGFSVPPGDYDLCVVVRERQDPERSNARPRAATLVLPLSVPDYSGPDLTASTVMLARRLDVLEAPVAPEDLSERPYAIGRNEISPALDARFARNAELIVVLLVYNATVSAAQQFDVEVQYHFFRRSGAPGGAVQAAGTHPPARAGETYFNHTEPQRFTPAVMGDQFDPDHPVLAGQGIPLASFPPGEYRVGIVVIDRLSGRTVTRDATFTVGAGE
jgi:hypothetical protein